MILILFNVVLYKSFLSSIKNNTFSPFLDNSSCNAFPAKPAPYIIFTEIFFKFSSIFILFFSEMLVVILHFFFKYFSILTNLNPGATFINFSKLQTEVSLSSMLLIFVI